MHFTDELILHYEHENTILKTATVSDVRGGVGAGDLEHGGMYN